MAAGNEIASAEELANAISEALSRHTSFTQSMFPHFKALSLDTDVRMSAFKCTLNKGIYFIADDLDIDGSLKRLDETGSGQVYLYTARLDSGKLRIPDDATLERMVEDGRAERMKDGSIKFSMSTEDAQPEFKMKVEAVKIPNLDRDDPLSLNEMAAWAAIQDRVIAGDEEQATRLFRATYGLAENPIEDDQEAPELQKQDANKAINHVQGISRLTEQLPKVDTMGQTMSVRMGKKNDKHAALTRVSLTYTDNDISLSRPVTPYDEEVHNAVASLWAAGNRVITASQVCQTMTGASKKPNPATLTKVEESLDKQRQTFVKIDYSQELKGKTGEFDGEQITADSAFIESYMLNADKQVIKATNGKTITGYVFKDAPALYRHDCTTKQIISYPQALLEATSKIASNTDTNILMRSYLIKRIKTMSRKGSKLTKQIRYDSVYKAAGKQDVNRKDAGRMNETIRKYLDAFQKEGLIASWSEYKDKGRSHKIIGVTISTKTGSR